MQADDACVETMKQKYPAKLEDKVTARNAAGSIRRSRRPASSAPMRM
jgi:hypothetical protein